LHVFATVFCASISILCRSVPTFQRIVQLLECSVWNCDEGVDYLRLNNEILATNHLRAPAERQRVARQIPPVNAFTGVETGQARPLVRGFVTTNDKRRICSRLVLVNFFAERLGCDTLLEQVVLHLEGLNYVASRSL